MNFSGRAAGTRHCELCGATTHSERECAKSGNPEPDLGDRLRSLESAVIAFARPSGPRVSGDNGRLMRPSGEVCRKWNGSGCTFPRCRHIHACLNCGGNHQVSRCGGPGPPRESPQAVQPIVLTGPVTVDW